MPHRPFSMPTRLRITQPLTLRSLSPSTGGEMNVIAIAKKSHALSDVRRTYVLNHSNLRGLARHGPSSEDRQSRLMQVCRERRYWYGDEFTPPASLGARMALRTLDGNIPDLMLVLASCVGLHLGARIPEVAKQLCRVRMAAYEAYRPGRLPG